VPFASFVVTRADGRAIRVGDAGQVAAGSDLRRFVIVTETGSESLSADELESCAITADPAHSPAAAGEDPTAAIMREIMARQEREKLGRRAVVRALAAVRSAAPADAAKNKPATPAEWALTPAIASGTGEPCFSLAGTKFDLHGIEVFENGVSLFLHHLDDPLTERRFIIWPPGQGTAKTFSEAQPLPQLAADTVKLDGIISDMPTLSVKETSKFHSPELKHESVRNSPTHDDRYGTKGASGASGANEKPRFALTLHTDEVAPHMWASRPLLTDTLASRPLLDLTGTFWDCEVEGEADSPKLSMRHYPDGGRWLTATINAAARSATCEGSGAIPVRFLQQHLANFGQHHQWEAMIAALRAGPLPADQPELRFEIPAPQNGACASHIGGWTLELWGAGDTAPLPFLWPRIIRSDGVVLLDWRGGPFGAGVVIWNKPNIAGLTLHPIIADERERQKDRRNVWIVVDLPSRRVTSAMLPGSTSLGVLHNLGRTCRTNSWLLQDLEQALARGTQLPLPEPEMMARPELLFY
jgi:hypothetical protein